MKANQTQKKKLPVYLMLVVSLILAGVFLRLLQTTTASANSSDIQLAENTYPNIVNSRIDTCSLCHTSNSSSLNSYGSAYKARGRGQATSLRAIEAVDSDNDQFTNLQELTALTYPGDPADHPVLATATNTPFQPATPTRTATQPPATATATNTRTATLPPAATATNTRTVTLPPVVTATAINNPTATQLAATATATNNPTSTQLAATATATKTPTATSVVRTATKTATPNPSASRTPTVRPTKSRPSVIPTCINFKHDKDSDDDDDDEDDRPGKPNCRHYPSPVDLHDSDHDSDADDQGRSNASKNPLGGLNSFLNSMFNRFGGK